MINIKMSRNYEALSLNPGRNREKGKDKHKVYGSSQSSSFIIIDLSEIEIEDGNDHANHNETT